MTIFHRRAQSDVGVRAHTRPRASSLRAFWSAFVKPMADVSRPPGSPPIPVIESVFYEHDEGSDDASDVDSIFSADAVMEEEEPSDPAARMLIHELELSLSSLSCTNAELRFHVSLLRALVRRLTREVHLARASRPKEAEHPHKLLYPIHFSSTCCLKENSPVPSSATGEIDHLAAALQATGICVPPEEPSTPPSESYFSHHSRSSSDTHPTTEGRSLSSLPPTPSTPFTPICEIGSPPSTKVAKGSSLPSSSRSSVRNAPVVKIGPPPKRPPLKNASLASSNTLRPLIHEETQAPRSSMSFFRSSRNSTVRPSLDVFLRPEPTPGRASLQLVPLPSPPFASLVPIPIPPRSSVDTRTRIPSFTHIRSSARKLRDTIRRRPAATPTEVPPSLTH